MVPSRLRTAVALTLLGLVAFFPLDGLALGSSRTSDYTSGSSASGSSQRSAIKCASRRRDSHGKSTRDPKAMDEFSGHIPNHPGIAHARWAISAY
jgi:hypothetical protein